MNVGDALEGMRAEIRALRSAVEARAVEPYAVTLRDAARRLSVSLSTVKRLVVTGRLLTVRVGDDPRVPVSELRRLTTPERKAPRGHRRRGSVKARTAEEMAEAFLARD